MKKHGTTIGYLFFLFGLPLGGALYSVNEVLGLLILVPYALMSLFLTLGWVMDFGNSPNVEGRGPDNGGE